MRRYRIPPAGRRSPGGVPAAGTGDILEAMTTSTRTRLLALVAASGCGDKGGVTTDDTGHALPFCYDFADADTYVVDQGGGDPGSGQVVARLITDSSASGDVRDPQYVAQMDYTMENLDVGGAPQAGKTDQDGAFTEEVGAGNWRISISGTKAGKYCENQIDIVVEDGNTTRVCLATACE
jgi:hypothetical protein